jgi:hypothetical protein
MLDPTSVHLLRVILIRHVRPNVSTQIYISYSQEMKIKVDEVSVCLSNWHVSKTFLANGVVCFVPWSLYHQR